MALPCARLPNILNITLHRSYKCSIYKEIMFVYFSSLKTFENLLAPTVAEKVWTIFRSILVTNVIWKEWQNTSLTYAAAEVGSCQVRYWTYLPIVQKRKHVIIAYPCKSNLSATKRWISAPPPPKKKQRLEYNRRID